MNLLQNTRFVIFIGMMLDVLNPECLPFVNEYGDFIVQEKKKKYPPPKNKKIKPLSPTFET